MEIYKYFVSYASFDDLGNQIFGNCVIGMEKICKVIQIREIEKKICETNEDFKDLVLLNIVKLEKEE